VLGSGDGHRVLAAVVPEDAYASPLPFRDVRSYDDIRRMGVSRSDEVVENRGVAPVRDYEDLQPARPDLLYGLVQVGVIQGIRVGIHCEIIEGFLVGRQLVPYVINVRRPA
jgi:hypothetical protein